MIAACSPADYNLDETLSTLRYASRAKAIKNKPRVNEDPKDALLKQYEDEIKQLKALLSQFQGGNGDAAAISAAMNNLKQIEENTSHTQVKTTVESPAQQAQSEMSVQDLLKMLEQRGQKVQLLDQSPDKQQSNRKAADEASP